MDVLSCLAVFPAVPEFGILWNSYSKNGIYESFS
jgi:hypothetical protein